MFVELFRLRVGVKSKKLRLGMIVSTAYSRRRTLYCTFIIIFFGLVISEVQRTTDLRSCCCSQYLHCFSDSRYVVSIDRLHHRCISRLAIGFPSFKGPRWCVCFCGDRCVSFSNRRLSPKTTDQPMLNCREDCCYTNRIVCRTSPVNFWPARIAVGG